MDTKYKIIKVLKGEVNNLVLIPTIIGASGCVTKIFKILAT